MKNTIILKTFAILFLGFFSSVYGQCKIENKVLADGTMMYYFEPATFYTTKSKSLKINVMTDDENFFIALQPTPFPEKGKGKKIKEDLSIELANKKWYKLKHYDTQYLKEDSILQVLYIINKDDLDDFRTNEAVIASINMEGTEFVRNYAFKLHKKAILEQLQCYFDSKKDEE